jgi:3-hydroxybutyryl-CoA dehydratase
MEKEPGAIAACVEFTVTERDMIAFKNLSGDTNPVHDDADFAGRHGFNGPIVYCGLIVAQVERLLGTRIPGAGCVCRWVSLKFRAPLYMDEPATVTASILNVNEELGLFDLKIRVQAGSRCIAEGETAAMLAREREIEHA